MRYEGTAPTLPTPGPACPQVLQPAEVALSFQIQTRSIRAFVPRDGRNLVSPPNISEDPQGAYSFLVIICDLSLKADTSSSKPLSAFEISRPPIQWSLRRA